MARCLTIGALAAALALMAGCAEAAPPSLSDGSVAAALADVLAEVDATIDIDATCPDLDGDLVAQTTVCSLAADGLTLTADVTIDEAGVVATDVREPLFRVADAADQLAEQFAADLGIAPPTVVCDTRILVVEVDATTTCTATHDGEPLAVELRILDENGAWEAVPVAPG